ncbi:MAG: PilZ domain-containing protein [Planctomycetes bacterium]|nr:PilZ domain-containing protein [Planctomycetota bacterium]
MAIERRKHPRRPLALRVSWQPVDLDTHHPAKSLDPAAMRHTATCDFSEGGLAFLSDVELVVDSAIALELEREIGGPPLSALGRVARCTLEDTGWRVGVELTWVEATQPDVGLGTAPENAWTLL